MDILGAYGSSDEDDGAGGAPAGVVGSAAAAAAVNLAPNVSIAVRGARRAKDKRDETARKTGAEGRTHVRAMEDDGEERGGGGGEEEERGRERE